MNVFEKIKERLRKEKYKDREEIYTNAQCDAIRYSFGMAIDIVNQIAEEFATDTNAGSKNGWIPCSERLPNCCGYPVLLTVKNVYGQRSVCKAFTNYMKEGKLLFYTNEKEYCSELTSSKLSDAWKPIAWQPLPEPYRPSEELGESKPCVNTECVYHKENADCEAAEGCAGYEPPAEQE